MIYKPSRSIIINDAWYRLCGINRERTDGNKECDG